MQKHKAGPALIDTGKSLMSGATGRWAGERLLAAMAAGRPIGPAELRSADTLRKDEWVAYDEALVEEGILRLRGIADLIAAGLTISVPNAMGKTLLEYEKVSDMQDAMVSLGGVGRAEDDRGDFTLDSVPLPIIHKDFDINLRTLVASRERGEALDTMSARVAGRKVSEMLEYILFNGSKTFGGKTVYGYLTHPNRNTVDFTDNYAWDHASKTGATILADVVACIKRLEADKFFGPYWLYVPTAYGTALDNDFKAASDLSIRQRLMLVDSIQKITVADQLPDGNIVMVQPTRDVVALVNGEGLQMVQWDVQGGFQINFKAFVIQVPLIRATAAGNSGVVHLSQL